MRKVHIHETIQWNVWLNSQPLSIFDFDCGDFFPKCYQTEKDSLSSGGITSFNLKVNILNILNIPLFFLKCYRKYFRLKNVSSIKSLQYLI